VLDCQVISSDEERGATAVAEVASAQQAAAVVTNLRGVPLEGSADEGGAWRIFVRPDRFEPEQVQAEDAMAWWDARKALVDASKEQAAAEASERHVEVLKIPTGPQGGLQHLACPQLHSGC
jgi:hypothetical protein